jgi:threonine aldolase
MHFASDNTSGASPRVLEAIVRANEGILPSYGSDPHSEAARRALATLFEADPAVALVTTGTAANALALATAVPSGGVAFCHSFAHVIDEECAAPEFFIGSGKLVGVPGSNGKIDPDALRATLKRFPAGVVRQAPAACLSLSQATESGTVYTLAEIRTLADIAHGAGLTVHMDGARFANALVSLGCSPAAMTHEAGVDVLSFGASKNGTLACEAVLVFDKAAARTLPVRLKRGGHVLSKGRFLGAQMTGYLTDGHWLELARHANAMAQDLATGLTRAGRIRLPWRCEANEVFPILPVTMAERLRAEGAVFYEWDEATLPEAERPREGEVFIRLLCSYATQPSEVERFVAIASAGA